MTKLRESMTVHDVIITMSEGNPGALTACMDILKQSDGLLSLLALDTYGIYGSQLYIVWNYSCERDTPLMIQLLAAVALELIPVSRLKELAGCCARQNPLTEQEQQVIRSVELSE